MATWTVTGQGTDGSTNQTFTGTDRIWLNATNFGDNVTVGSYQDSTHRANSSDVHQCTSVHLHNIKFVDSTHFILDGGGSTALSSSIPTTANCPFKFNFADASSVATSGGKFYAYDGTTDATAMVGVTVQAFERSNTTWTSCNGSGAALTLADQAAATSHDFFLALSMTPSATGAKTGKVKATLTYV